ATALDGLTLDGLKPVLHEASAEITASVTASPATWRDALASAAVFANSHLSQFVLAWMLGVLLLSVRLMFGWIKAHRIATKDAFEATSEWQRIARRLAQAL